MPTAWYSHYINRILFSVPDPKDQTKLLQCSEYGITYRAYFDIDDVEILEKIKLIDKRVIKWEK